MKIQLFERAASLSPYLILFIYTAGCIFCLLTGRISFLINGSIMAAPAILGSFAIVRIMKKDFDLSEGIRIFPCKRYMPVIFFVLFYALTVQVLFVSPAGSRWGLLPVLILYAIIFTQILSDRSPPAVVLIEIMLTLAVTIYSYTLRSALYFGMTDILPHSYISTVTYLSGHVTPGELGNYTYFPLYHIFVAISSHMLGLDIHTSLFVVTCLVFSLTVFFLYYLVNTIYHNKQLSLLVALVYSMNADVIYYGAYMVTRSMAYVGFLILLFLIYSLKNPGTDARCVIARPGAKRICFVMTVIFILLVHQISTPMIIILIGLLIIFELFVRDENHVSTVTLLVPITLFAAYWAFVSYPFLKELLPRIDPVLYQNIIITDVVHSLGLRFLVNQIDTLIIVFFALTGAIYLIWKQQPRDSIVFGIFGLFSLLLNVPSILTVVFQLVAVLRIDRFALLFLPFLAIVMGFGVYIFSRYLSTVKMRTWLVEVLLIALIVLYGIGSLGLIKTDELGYTRQSFNQDEITGFDHVLKTVPSGSSLYSDYYTSRFFARPRIDQSERLGLPYYTSYWIGSDLETPEEKGYTILPDRQFRRNGLLFEKGGEFDPESLQPYLPTAENIQNVTGRLSTEDKIYSNRGVDVYRSPDRQVLESTSINLPT